MESNHDQQHSERVIHSTRVLYNPSYMLCTYSLYYDTDILYCNYFFLLVQCKLIIGQMSNQPTEPLNFLFVPFIIAVGTSFVLPQYEFLCLYALTAVSLVTHLHFGISVVSKMYPSLWVVYLSVVFFVYFYQYYNAQIKKKFYLFCLCFVFLGNILLMKLQLHHELQLHEFQLQFFWDSWHNHCMHAFIILFFNYITL